jgi:hypothetical protein
MHKCSVLFGTRYFYLLQVAVLQGGLVSLSKLKSRGFLVALKMRVPGESAPLS